MSALPVVSEIRTELERMQPQFAAALPPQITPARFVRVAMTAVQRDPSLLQADRKSLFAACMLAAQDGLLPDGREAALVIFGGKVQYLPMVGGVLKKIRQSGELLSIAAHVVYERDTFGYALGDEEHISHVPYLDGERGNPRLVYAIAKTRDGGIYREVMTVAEVEQVRAVSRAKGTGPWVQWWGEMARKTVIRRLAKRLPMSTDAEDMLHHDEELADYVPPSSAAAQLSERLRHQPLLEDEGGVQVEPRWPEKVRDPETGEVTWTDADGTHYDERLHGWDASRQRPSVKPNGEFRARRGSARRPDPDLPPIDAPVDGQEDA